MTILAILRSPFEDLMLPSIILVADDATARVAIPISSGACSSVLLAENWSWCCSCLQRAEACMRHYRRILAGDFDVFGRRGEDCIWLFHKAIQSSARIRLTCALASEARQYNFDLLKKSRSSIQHKVKQITPAWQESRTISALTLLCSV